MFLGYIANTVDESYSASDRRNAHARMREGWEERHCNRWTRTHGGKQPSLSLEVAPVSSCISPFCIIRSRSDRAPLLTPLSSPLPLAARTTSVVTPTELGVHAPPQTRLPSFSAGHIVNTSVGAFLFAYISTRQQLRWPDSRVSTARARLQECCDLRITMRNQQRTKP